MKIVSQGERSFARARRLSEWLGRRTNTAGAWSYRSDQSWYPSSGGTVERTSEARAGLRFRIRRERGWEPFDGDVTTQARIARAVHFTHAAGAKRRLNLIGPRRRS